METVEWRQGVEVGDGGRRWGARGGGMEWRWGTGDGDGSMGWAMRYESRGENHRFYININVA